MHVEVGQVLWDFGTEFNGVERVADERCAVCPERRGPDGLRDETCCRAEEGTLHLR